MGKETICNSVEEAEIEYSKYINTHIENVGRAFELFGRRIYEYCIARRSEPYPTFESIELKVSKHDQSKYSDEEFKAYRLRFFPTKKEFEEIGQDEIRNQFDEAWKHHYTYNSHHPEFWSIGINKESNKLHMSIGSIVEMICDWIAMSMNFHQSTYEWWMSPKGKADKEKYMCEEDIVLVTNILIANKKDFDFRNVNEEA